MLILPPAAPLGRGGPEASNAGSLLGDTPRPPGGKKFKVVAPQKGATLCRTMTERVRCYISTCPFAFIRLLAVGVDVWGLAVSSHHGEAGDAVLDSFDHPAGPIVWQMEPDRVLWNMVGSARRPDGCRR